MGHLIFSNRGGGDFSKKEELTTELLKKHNPRYVFFPFWSWKIPKETYENFECIVFHCTNVPFGRGGSPLQNLILCGHKTTKISALKCVEELDAGPVYLKRDFDISRGSADKLYDGMLKVIFEDMIPYILKHNPKPIPQEGAVVEFDRATLSDSDLLLWLTGEMKSEFVQPSIYDLIRAFDTNYENLHRAFVDVGDMRLEFYNATPEGAQVRFIEKEKECGRLEKKQKANTIVYGTTLGKMRLGNFSDVLI